MADFGLGNGSVLKPDTRSLKAAHDLRITDRESRITAS